jgi:hypothetical protein
VPFAFFHAKNINQRHPLRVRVIGIDEFRPSIVRVD